MHDKMSQNLENSSLLLNAAATHNEAQTRWYPVHMHAQVCFFTLPSLQSLSLYSHTARNRTVLPGVFSSIVLALSQWPKTLK